MVLDLEAKEFIIKHMNEDHDHHMLLFVQYLKGMRNAKSVEMTGVSETGFVCAVQMPSTIVQGRTVTIKTQFTFPRQVIRRDDVREFFLDMLKLAEKEKLVVDRREEEPPAAAPPAAPAALHFESDGAADVADAPTSIVLVHGWPDSSFSWKPTAAALAKALPDAAVLRIDLPGFGESWKPAADGDAANLSIDKYIEYVASFIETKRLQNVVLCGHSMGSLIAHGVAARHATLVAKLVLVGTTPTAVGNAPLLEAKEALEAMGEIDEAFAREFQTGTIHDVAKVDPAFVDGIVAASLSAPKHCWTMALDGMLADDHSSQLDQITADTLVLVGEADELFPLAGNQAVADAVGGSATLQTIPDAGHSPIWDCPDVVADRIATFIIS